MGDQQSGSELYRAYTKERSGAGLIFEEMFPDQDASISADKPYDTDLDFRLDLIDPNAILRLGKILKTGADRGYGEGWRGVGPRHHVNHALGHLLLWLADDDEDDHLGSAFARIMMAIGVSD